MAGTLTISTLSDGTNSTSATNCIQGSAKAWVNWNGNSGASIFASYNVSSVTRNATGDYTINFSNALSDTNYAVASSLCSFTTSEPRVLTVIQGSLASGATLKSTTQLRITTASSSTGVYYDNPNISYVIYR